MGIGVRRVEAGVGVSYMSDGSLPIPALLNCVALESL